MSEKASLRASTSGEEECQAGPSSLPSSSSQREHEAPLPSPQPESNPPMILVPHNSPLTAINVLGRQRAFKFLAEKQYLPATSKLLKEMKKVNAIHGKFFALFKDFLFVLDPADTLKLQLDDEVTLEPRDPAAFAAVDIEMLTVAFYVTDLCARHPIKDVVSMLNIPEFSAKTDILKFFGVSTLTPNETIPFTHQRLANILAHNYFIRRHPESPDFNHVYMHVKSMACRTFRGNLISAKRNPEDFFVFDSLVDVGGHQYVRVNYTTFMTYVVGPWFDRFLETYATTADEVI